MHRSNETEPEVFRLMIVGVVPFAFFAIGTLPALGRDQLPSFTIRRCR
jgi:hypothetical protein